MFQKGWYLNLGLLFNNNGLSQPVNNWGNINLKLSPQNLMPTRWNFILTTSKEFTPLLSTNISVLYAPGTNLIILLPTIRYNLASNLDADIIWQSFFAELNNDLEAVNHRSFLRIKWSFQEGIVLHRILLSIFVPEHFLSSYEPGRKTKCKSWNSLVWTF